MFKSFLISMAKELVFDAIILTLREQAKKTTGGFDDAAVDLLVAQKSELLAQLGKAF